MKISSYEICANSQHQYEARQEIRRELGLVLSKKPILSNLGIQLGGMDNTSISSEAKNKYLSSNFFQMDKTVEISRTDKKASSMDGEKQLVSRLVSHAAKKNISFLQEDVVANISRSRWQNPSLGISPGNSLTISAMTTKTFQENENTDVTTQGVIETQDGRQITFGMHLSMERRFMSEGTSMEKFSTSQLIDPLVIQFEDGPPSFSNKIFSFDLTGDGKKETLQSLGKGSGFLAFDMNGDGKVNDGTELFGTRSGNGFADLAKYDEDGNGWIDENDSIFSKLSVWRPETEGQKEYSKSLLDSNVGAIFLGQTESAHTLSDEKGNIHGVIQSTGMFVKETGETGHVFQMDLARKKGTEIKKTDSKNLLQSSPPKNNPRKNALSAIREAMKRVSISLDNRYKLLLEENQEDAFSDTTKRLKKQMERLFSMFGADKRISHRA